ncbi:MAG: UDP-3-O-acyl-N-acetylglucosamine deacetylase [Candidatus Eremiobacteraeota bacterium]|nr:UDP-3-O-acyl-N-acetylglucosamine deacetylase [Candidatus Eremiobacteraeota bacterium]
MKAATLSESLRFEGIGLHTGERATMEIRPAKPYNGIVFELTDGIRVPALAEYAVETPLATILSSQGRSVSTVEHVLSALLGMGVSDADIVLRGSEVPILDGSTAAYAAAINRVGLEFSSEPRPVFAPNEPFELRSGERAVVVLPAPVFRVRFVAQYGAPIGTHYFDAEIEPAAYAKQIAPARTFAFLRDVEAMREQGLARGGTLDNALVFDDDGPMQSLRWENEIVRHKVLDLIGDFALLGAWPRCEVIAIKSGHAMHARVTRALRQQSIVSTAGREAC